MCSGLCEAVKWIASRTLNILLAEDTLVNQQVILAILGKLNHQITIAANGKEAVDCVEAKEFDIILMDIRMPEMDGLQATAIIRSLNSEKSKIPIIALTADISAGNIAEYIDTGMGAVVEKPLKLPELLKAINAQLREEIHAPVEPMNSSV